MVSRLPAGNTETGNEVEFDSEIITKTCFFTNFYAANRQKISLKRIFSSQPEKSNFGDDFGNKMIHLLFI